MAPNKATGSGHKESLWHSEIYESGGNCKTPFLSCTAARMMLIRTPRASIVGAVILDFSPEFFLQFGVRNLNHSGTAVGTAVRQITSEQITN
jgi:hypothetical protein